MVPPRVHQSLVLIDTIVFNRYIEISDLKKKTQVSDTGSLGPLLVCVNT